MKANFALIRGICQLPVYVAHETGEFQKNNVESSIRIVPAAWMVPSMLQKGEVEFGVIPWTRVAIAAEKGENLIVIAGGGVEEGMILARPDMERSDISTIAVPQPGGVKDFFANELISRASLSKARLVSNPSGDASLVSYIGGGADAISTIEPFGSMLEFLGLGTVIAKIGDIFPRMPGCCLSTTKQMVATNRDLCIHVIAAMRKSEELIRNNPSLAAAIGQKYIGISAEIIQKALTTNLPSIDVIQETDVIRAVVMRMLEMGRLHSEPERIFDRSFLE
ncbi:MAG: ABC transporter substrate-binding protein [Verrucomicrobiaceae bacterium]|nr:ABC transporter substrate-binding protein [Verrucomicrobiaceae bacterium]